MKRLFISLIFIGVSTQTFANLIPDKPRFKYVMAGETGSVGSTLVIHQDKFGFMWFGGKAGLARFDGTNYVYYLHDPENPDSISNEVVWDIEEDERGNLWIATEYGLNFYHRESQTFKKYISTPSDVTSLDNNNVTMLFKDSKGNFWVGTNAGLNLFDEQSGTFTRYPVNAQQSKLAGEYVLDMDEDINGVYYLATGYGLKVWDPETDEISIYQHIPGDPKSLRHSACRSIDVTESGNVWVGTEEGLHRFDTETKSFTSIPTVGVTTGQPIYAPVWDVMEDSRGDVWLSGDGGLSRYNQETTEMFSFFKNPLDPDSVLTNVTRSLFEDINGDLWAGHFPSGVSVLEVYNTTFQNYRNVSSGNTSINANTVRGIVEDKNYDLWFAVDGGGLNFFDVKQQQFKSFIHEPGNSNSPTNNSFQNVVLDNQGRIWFGMWNGGAGFYDPLSNTFENVLADALANNSIPSNHVSTIIAHADKKIYMGSMDGGLTVYDPDSKKLNFFYHNPADESSISHNRIWVLLEHSDGKIWVGTHNGLDLFDPKKESFQHYRHRLNDSDSLVNNWVHSLYLDKRGFLWVGTHGGGVSVLNPKTNKFTHLTEMNGLADNIVNGIIEDDIGNMWITTNNGVTRYTLKSKEIKNFYVEDGLQGNIFNRGAIYKTHDHQIILGGTNGFTKFDPRLIQINEYLPPTVLTKLEVNNELVDAQHSSLSKNLLLEEELVFNHKQNIFTLHYSSLNYRSYENNTYKYLLDGFDERWQKVKHKTSATYTNLSPGSYEFKVIGSNNEGAWGKKMARVKITVLPAPWQTWWAYLLYFIIVGAIVLTYVISQRKIIKYQKTIVDRLKSVDKVKNEFIASTSHELKTPLFGIIGLVENILDRAKNKLDEEEKSNLSLIVSSCHRLTSQVQDVLDYSDFDSESLVLEFEPVCLAELIKVISREMTPIVQKKNIHLVTEIEDVSLLVSADSNRLQQVLYNLVANSYKYTEFGKITITTTKIDDNLVKVCVADTGSGVPEDEKDGVFEAFSKLKDVDQGVQGGTGLGLTLSRNIIKLHGGDIWIDSQEGEGTIVSFTLVVAKGVGRKVVLSPIVEARVKSIVVDDAVLKPEVQSISQGPTDKVYTIMIVDDEAVNRLVLQGYLRTKNYHVVLIENGEQALRYLSENELVDLVLLDIMMPDLSGYEVCKRIRKRYSQSQLPILFITAKSQTEDMEEAYTIGGNDFLPKPIAKQELLNRVSFHLQLYEANIRLEKKVDDRTQQLEEAYEKIDQLSMKDPLTGLYNNYFFKQIIAPLTAECLRHYKDKVNEKNRSEISAHDMTFYFVDVDNLKDVNDRYGHTVGDKLLSVFAERLLTKIRQSDYLVRIGGDEFLLICRNSPRNEAFNMARRLVKTASEQPFNLDEISIPLTVSVGYCCYPLNIDRSSVFSWEQSVDFAQHCSSNVKKSGKNNWLGLVSTILESTTLSEIDKAMSDETIIYRSGNDDKND